MKALGLLLALTMGAQAAPSIFDTPAAERQALARVMDVRRMEARRHPELKGLGEELEALRARALRPGDRLDADALRLDYEDWLRRFEAALSGRPLVAGKDYPDAKAELAQPGTPRIAPRAAAAIGSFSLDPSRFGLAADGAASRPALEGRAPIVPASVRRAQAPDARRRIQASSRRSIDAGGSAPDAPAAERAPSQGLTITIVTHASHAEPRPIEKIRRRARRALERGADAVREVIDRLLKIPLLFYTRISSAFGERFHPVLHRWIMHTGVDFATPKGTPVIATGDGRVIRAGWYGGYGRAVILQHAEGVQTLYGHLSRVNVRVGQRVGRGEMIGKSGDSGLVTGPNLHYETRRDGVPFNPFGY